MSWVYFYLLALLYPIAFLVIAWKCNTWRQRLGLWGLMAVAAIGYCWDYFYVQIEHKQMCAAEAGLRVFIQPEKADRVRYVGDGFGEGVAKDIFSRDYSNVKVVEVMTEARDQKTGRRLDRFDAYTAAPNPKVGQPMKAYPWKELPYVLTVTPVETPDSSVYEISETATHGKRYRREDVLLTRNGQPYARHSTFVHHWSGIQYPDAVPHWRCPDTNRRFAPKDDPHAPYERWEAPPSGSEVLRNLILK